MTVKARWLEPGRTIAVEVTDETSGLVDVSQIVMGANDMSLPTDVFRGHVRTLVANAETEAWARLAERRER